MTKHKGQDVGYIRVSSVYQTTDRQLDEVELDRCFEEKISAKNANRPILKDCVAYLRSGDTLHVHSIDRLARNLIDLQSIVKQLNDEGVSVKFHKEGLTFTGEENPMNKLMLHMMGAFAEFERSLIKERQMEGIKVAQKKGIKFGRNKSLSDDIIKEIKDRIANGEQKKALAKEYGVSRQTIYSSIA